VPIYDNRASGREQIGLDDQKQQWQDNGDKRAGDKNVGAGQLRKDRWDKTAVTGKLRDNGGDMTAREGSQDNTARTGREEKEARTWQ
jgi:hypothetical protein